MSVGFYRESPGKFDSRTLSRETLSIGGLVVAFFSLIYVIIWLSAQIVSRWAPKVTTTTITTHYEY